MNLLFVLSILDSANLYATFGAIKSANGPANDSLTLAPDEFSPVFLFPYESFNVPCAIWIDMSPLHSL